ncbi:MAG: glycosyltransferase family 4 protein [Saprospiraceae bacterium]|jgi:glycosyltransferase involved in cell wall biosynthesis|nr:glycosyltransferase family 4 protein [Saprospiraceae bacterium]
MKTRKFIYILNHYSDTSASHFYHILHLVEEIARQDTDIALIIEKCDGLPSPAADVSSRIRILGQKASSSWSRPFELSRLLFALNAEGYHTVFIRISWVAAVVAIITSWFTGQKTWYWLSGQGSIEHYQALKPGFAKVREFIGTRLPFIFIKRFVHRFVTGPESMAKYMTEVGGVSSSRLTVLYNDVQLKRFLPVDEHKKQEFRKKWKIAENALVILFVHRFSPIRRTNFYLPSIFEKFSIESSVGQLQEINRPVTFVLIGGGPEKEHVRQLCEQIDFPFPILWQGELPNKDISVFYQLSDVFIQPTWAEGFPRVLLEAMASGLPVVSTDAGGILDITGPLQSTFVVKKEDREAFAVKCLQLALDPVLRKQLSAENLLQVRRFDTTTVAKMYIQKLFG